MTAKTLRLARPVLLAIATGLYLLAAHLTTALEGPSTLGAILAILPITLIVLAMAWRARQRVPALTLWSGGLVALILAWPLIESSFAWLYFIQHLGVFSLLAIAFARTLAPGEVPMITRFARLVHGVELAPELLPYTRAVTFAWVLFFSGMATTSILLFAFSSLATWSLFVNLLTPVLVGLMFAIEFAVRLLVLPREVRTGLLDSIRAFIDSARGASPPIP